MEVLFIFISVGFFSLYRGSFGADTDKVSVFVIGEGDSVTLNTGVVKTQQDRIKWYYNDIRIAQINGDLSKTCTDVKCNEGTERFRGRLKLNNQTGSLTITNTTNTDAGEYKLLITRGNIDIEKIFSVSVHGVSAAEREKSVKEGESVTLDPGVIINPSDVMMWHFNEILIAEIAGDQSKICTDVQCKERFRDRLKLDHQTGSLTITNTRNTDSGVYNLQINRSSLRRRRRSISSVKSFDVTVIADPDSGVSSGAVAGIAVAVLLLVFVAAAAGVIYYRRRSPRKAGMEEKQQRASVESPNKEMETFLQTKIEVT